MLLRTFDPDADDDEVPDPYYGPDPGFDEVLAMTEAAAPGVVEEIRRRLDRAGVDDRPVTAPGGPAAEHRSGAVAFLLAPGWIAVILAALAFAGACFFLLRALAVQPQRRAVRAERRDRRPRSARRRSR